MSAFSIFFLVLSRVDKVYFFSPPGNFYFYLYGQRLTNLILLLKCYDTKIKEGKAPKRLSLQISNNFADSKNIIFPIYVTYLLFPKINYF